MTNEETNAKTTQPQPQPQAVAQAPAATTAVAKKQDYTPEMTAAAIRKLPAMLEPLKKLMAQPWESFRAAFKDPREADRVMQREITYTAEAMVNNSFLISCAQKFPQEFVNAMKNVALSGLSLSPTLKQGYLVPFKGKVVFMPSYMGMKDLLANNGHVRKIESFAVFEGDSFDMTHGTKEELVHKPNPWGQRTPDKMLGCYWIAELTDGTKMFDNMTKAEIDAVMQRSPSVGKGQSSPWQTDYIEMAKKTCLRRGFKSLPKGSISDERLRVLDAAFDYQEKEERNFISQPDAKAAKSRYDFEEVEEIEAVEVDTETGEVKA